jgi:hypothetical protein
MICAVLLATRNMYSGWSRILLKETACSDEAGLHMAADAV